MKSRRVCDLCGREAALHCESDSAFLCWSCDARVHGANFLVARHLRRVLCLECSVPDPDRRAVSGPGSLRVFFLCSSCDDVKQGEDNGGGGGGSSSDSESSSCCSSSLRSFRSSSCVSRPVSGAEASFTESGTVIAPIPCEGDGPIKGAACSVSSGAESECSKPSRARASRRSAGTAPVRRELDARTEGILLTWCRRMGLDDDVRALGAASYALGAGTRRMAAMPFRVVVAAAAWFAAKLCCPGAAEGVRRSEALLRGLQACSGVPARLIVVAEARLARAVRRRHVGEEGEGWAECP